MKLLINQQVHDVDVPADTTLLNYLRGNGLTGTKEGCASGDCGACTVMVGTPDTDGIRYRTVNACIAPVGQFAGEHVVTVEGLAEADQLHPAQQAMVDCHGSQCGFCTPGFVMSLAALVENNSVGSDQRERVLQGISGNLCRCTGYRPIVDAGLRALQAPPTARLHDAAVFDMMGESSPAHDRGGVHLPTSEDELQRTMQRYPDARLIGGGTDLMLEVTQLYRHLPELICLGRVAELNRIEETGETLVIGAGVPYTLLEDWFADRSSPMFDLLQRLGSRQIRNSGTPGGNLANGSPIADMPPALIAWDARLELVSAAGASRVVSIDDFYLDYRKTVLAQDEYIARIHIPLDAMQDFHRFYKSSKRIEDDISSVMGAFRFKLDGGRISQARVAFGGMAATPVRLGEVETLLEDAAPGDEQVLSQVIEQLEVLMTPLTDVRASAAYRAAMAGAMLSRALAEAAGTRLPTVMEVDPGA